MRTLDTTATFTKAPHDLEREAHRLLSVVTNLLQTRAKHPTYGTTKATVRTALLRAEAVVLAYDFLVTDSMFADNVGDPRLPLVRRLATVRDDVEAALKN